MLKGRIKNLHRIRDQPDYDRRKEIHTLFEKGTSTEFKNISVTWRN